MKKISELTDLDKKRSIFLSSIDLPKRVINCMYNLSTTNPKIRLQGEDTKPIRTLGDLLDLVNDVPDRDLLTRIPNFSTRSLLEVHKLLAVAFPVGYRGSSDLTIRHGARYTYKN
jgi:hypothetical protein